MAINNRSNLLRQLPAVDEVLRAPRVAALLLTFPRTIVVEAVRSSLDSKRRHILELNDEQALKLVGMDTQEHLHSLVTAIETEIEKKTRPNLRRVINATGVVLHTNLGRALLSKKAREAVQMAASGYCNLELDLNTGKRGSRYAAVEELLTRLTGAEAALVVNNNAAAVLLALGTLASGREVIVSRGQLVEIGGSFRIPEVMSQSGAKLVEVGATNKTYPEDYRRVINQDTALLLHVHTSNYRIVGFTRETTIEELVDLGKKYQVPVMSDLGSGFLIDLGNFGLPHEPTVQQVVAAGPDVVTFSGDKLLGGPQAGIIVGRKEYVERMKKNPLTRAVRIDKFTVAALEATLRNYLDETALKTIPTLSMLTASMEVLTKKAHGLRQELDNYIGQSALLSVESASSAVGGGAMPTADLPTMIVSIKPFLMAVEKLAERLRQTEPAVIGRVQDEALFLDVRTIDEDEFPLLARALSEVLQTKGE